MQKDLLPFVLVTKKAKTGQFCKVTEAQRHWFLRGSCKWFLKIKMKPVFYWKENSFLVYALHVT